VKLVRGFLNVVEKATEIWGGASVIMISVLMVLAVILRYTIGGSIEGSWIIMTLLMVWFTFASIGSISRRDEHIKIGLLAEMVLRQRAKAFRYTLENAVALPLCIYMSWAGWHWVDFRIKQGGEEFLSTGVSIPDWIPILIVPIGFNIATLYYLERLVKQVNSYLRQRRERQHTASTASQKAEEDPIAAAQDS